MASCRRTIKMLPDREFFRSNRITQSIQSTLIIPLCNDFLIICDHVFRLFANKYRPLQP